MPDELHHQGRPVIWRDTPPVLERVRDDWQTAALCRWVVDHWGWHPDVWFPAGKKATAHARRVAAAAARVCAHCTVAVECDAFADRDDIRHGIWAGRWLDAPERRVR